MSDEESDYIQVLEVTVENAREEVVNLLGRVKMGIYNPDIDGSLEDILLRLERMLAE